MLLEAVRCLVGVSVWLLLEWQVSFRGSQSYFGKEPPRTNSDRTSQNWNYIRAYREPLRRNGSNNKGLFQRPLKSAVTGLRNG